MKQLNLNEIMIKGHCSFELSKKMAKSGMRALNFGSHYDEHGFLITSKENNCDNEPQFPAINVYEAISLLKGVTKEKIAFYYDQGLYVLKIADKECIGLSKVDTLCEMYFQLIMNDKRKMTNETNKA